MLKLTITGDIATTVTEEIPERGAVLMILPSGICILGMTDEAAQQLEEVAETVGGQMFVQGFVKVASHGITSMIDAYRIMQGETTPINILLRQLAEGLDGDGLDGVDIRVEPIDYHRGNGTNNRNGKNSKKGTVD